MYLFFGKRKVGHENMPVFKVRRIPERFDVGNGVMVEHVLFEQGFRWEVHRRTPGGSHQTVGKRLIKTLLDDVFYHRRGV